jgi:hypothetical protein
LSRPRARKYEGGRAQDGEKHHERGVAVGFCVAAFSAPRPQRDVRDVRDATAVEASAPVGGGGGGVGEGGGGGGGRGRGAEGNCFLLFLLLLLPDVRVDSVVVDLCENGRIRKID